MNKFKKLLATTFVLLICCTAFIFAGCETGSKAYLSYGAAAANEVGTNPPVLSVSKSTIVAEGFSWKETISATWSGDFFFTPKKAGAQAENIGKYVDLVGNGMNVYGLPGRSVVEAANYTGGTYELEIVYRGASLTTTLTITA